MLRVVIRLLLAAVAAGLLVTDATAHEGLHQQIARATARVAAEPENARVYLERGELHRRHRSWDLAEADYEKAAALDPELDAVLFSRGRFLLEAGRPQEALEELDRYLSRRPRHGPATVARARALYALKRNAEAALAFDAALALFAEPRPTYYLERAKALAAAGDVTAAVRGLDEGRKKLGAVITLQLLAIELEVRQGRHDAALRRVEDILGRARRKERWLAKKGEILTAAGRRNEARKAFAGALAAIEALPARHRSTPAMRKLNSTVRAQQRNLQLTGNAQR